MSTPQTPTPQSTTPVLSKAIHGKVDPQVEHVINLLSNGLKDAHDAIIQLKGQHDALKTTVTTVQSTVNTALSAANQVSAAQLAAAGAAPAAFQGVIGEQTRFIKVTTTADRQVLLNVAHIAAIEAGTDDLATVVVRPETTYHVKERFEDLLHDLS